MKFRLLFLAFTLIATTSFAQQLSIDETINYIQKKARETKDLSRTYNDKLTYRISDVGFGRDKENVNKVILQYTRNFSDNTTDKLQYIFDVTHLSSLSLTSDPTTTEVVGMLDMKFVGNSVLLKKSTNGNVEDSNKSSFLMPYFKIDPLNFQRLKLAFDHLKESFAAKKAPDPFAN